MMAGLMRKEASLLRFNLILVLCGGVIFFTVLLTLLAGPRHKAFLFLLGLFIFYTFVLYFIIDRRFLKPLEKPDPDINELKTLLESLKKRLAQQEVISAVSQSFISAGDMIILINNALLMIGNYMNVSKMVLAHLDPETNMLVYEQEWYNGKHGVSRLPKRAYPFGPGEIVYDTFIIRGDVYLACDDVEKSPEVAKYLQPLGIKAFIYVPIYVYGSFWGVLSADECTGPRIWEEWDIQLIKLVANVIAGLIIRSNTEDEFFRMSSIVDSSPQYISYITPAGQFKYFNQGVCVNSGYTQEELKKQGIGILFDAETNKIIREKFIPSVLDQGNYQCELPLVRKDGEIRILSFSAFTIDTKKNSIGLIASDITESRRLEKELITAKEQAEQSNLAKSNFLSRMSHEMRTPMNAIIGMTTIAQTSANMEKMEYCLSKINEASIHLLGVINDILDMSKIEAGKFDLVYSEFDFEQMLHRVTNVMNFRVTEKKQRLIIHIDRDVPSFIISDEQRLAQVLTNLLSNAVKFTPVEGTITLLVKKKALEKPLSTLRFEVADTGIGISTETQSRLFTLFEQADGSIARKYGGTGLGLAISKSIVELMGGEIGVNSEEGKGAVFFFEINVEEGKNAGKNYSRTNMEKLRILAVDDSPEGLDYFKDFAASLGIRCVTASDGPEALDILQAAWEGGSGEAPFDMVFVDWHMPEINGIDLTRKIKERFGQKMTVIMISAVEWDSVEKEANEAGVDGFILKPLFFSTLVDCINIHSQFPQNAVPSEAAAEFPDFSGYHILLAEDVEINREIVISLLEDTGVSIDCAENGAEAVKMFEAAPARYGMIFMDIHMPEMDGFEATKRIRASSVAEAKNIPIVAMTANVFKDDIEKCLAAGMNDHLGKPIDLEELMKKINAYLRTRTKIT
jgi:PAS domain S-box-containing protein